MKKYGKEMEENRIEISIYEFLEYYNKNIPESFPQATIVLLKKFKEKHKMLFKDSDLWSLDQHRKKLIDWLPYNNKVL